MAILFALTVPVMADKKAEKSARNQCSVQYRTAKKNADRLANLRARSVARNDARKNYNACVARAKRLN